jgi:peroxiredoxin Q/BCP
MPIPSPGQAAPDFHLPDQSGQDVRLSQLRGQHVVLYFYPRDNTPGCTQEACDFRDEHSALRAAGAVVLGVSPDTAASHQKFITKFSLPFPLLVDEGHAVADAYGVWGEKTLAGRKYMGLIRSTFLIDPQGRVARAWPKVKVAGHVQEILQALRSADAPGEPEPGAAARKAPAKKAAAKKAPAPRG